MSSAVSRPSTSSMEVTALEEPEMYLRKRILKEPSDEDLEPGELSDALSEDEDAPGCPLPSTPVDNELLEAEVSIVTKLR